MKKGNNTIVALAAEQEFVFVHCGTNQPMFFTRKGELLSDAILHKLRHERDTVWGREALACGIEQQTHVHTNLDGVKKELRAGNKLITQIAKELGADICQTFLPDFEENWKPIVSVPGDKVFNGIIHMHKDDPKVAQGVITTSTHLHANTDDRRKTIQLRKEVNNVIARTFISEGGLTNDFLSFVGATRERWEARNRVLHYRKNVLKEILGTFDPQLILEDAIFFVENEILQNNLHGRSIHDILQDPSVQLFDKKDRTQKPWMGPIKLKKPGPTHTLGKGITLEVATADSSHGHDDIMEIRIDTSWNLIQTGLSNHG